MTTNPAPAAPRAGPLSQERLLIAVLLAVAAVCWWLTLAADMAMDARLPGFLLTGYLLVWTALGVPAYLAWRAVSPAVMGGEAWAGRFAGAALLVAAVHQLSPLKDVCLSRCRSPLGMFLRARGDLRRPLTAVRLGAGHAAYCVGCCWAFMLVLVAVGVMEPLWMVGVAALIFAEKALPSGERVVRPAALLLAAGGVVLLVAPHVLSTVTTA
jgi:predicted metal-binding membrane protein